MNPPSLSPKRTLPRVASRSVGSAFSALLVFLALGVVTLPAFPTAERVTDEPKLIGTWRFLTQAEDYYYTLDLKADGRFAIFCRLSTGSTFNLSGRWSCQKKRLHFIYEHSSVPFTKPKDPNARDILVEVTDTTLIVIEYGEGGQKVYRRLNGQGK